jgi:hypothetical protein
MHPRTLAIFISLFSVFAPAAVNAAGSLPEIVLHDQMNTAVVNAWYSDSTLSNPQSIGDSFQSTEIWSITSIVWRGVYQDNAAGVADDFKVAMWAVSGGLPSSQISNLPGSVTRTSTGTNVPWGWNLFEYTLTLNQPFILNPGTYVLEVQNQTTDSPKNWAWTTGSGDRFLYHVNDVWYAGDFGNPQFQVIGAVVPEPASALFALVGMSWICVGLRRRTL